MPAAAAKRTGTLHQAILPDAMRYLSGTISFTRDRVRLGERKNADNRPDPVYAGREGVGKRLKGRRVFAGMDRNLSLPIK